ncbi:MAG: porin family protein [Bacteroidales bacterium]
MKFKIMYLRTPFFLCFIGLLLVLSANKIQGQENCAFKLEEAQNQYDIGVLDSIPVMLNPCINKGFSGDELARAYKLLILTYLFQDNQESAKSTMKKFLKKFPEYEIKANDPVEFAYLYKTFKTIPVYSIGILLGGNYSYVRLIEPYGVNNTNDYNGKYSTLGIGFQGGLQIKRYINEKIEISLDMLYKSSKYEFVNKPTSYSTTIFEESQTGFDIPLTATYDFAYSFKGFNPYLRAGFSFGYLMSSSGKLKLNNEVFTGLEDISSAEFDITTNRNTYNFSGVVGAGIKYKIKNGGYIIGDFRYYLGILNVVNTNERYSNLENNLGYMYVDNDFALNNFTFSLGYVWSFYKTSEKSK